MATMQLADSAPAPETPSSANNSTPPAATTNVTAPPPQSVSPPAPTNGAAMLPPTLPPPVQSSPPALEPPPVATTPPPSPPVTTPASGATPTQTVPSPAPPISSTTPTTPSTTPSTIPSTTPSTTPSTIPSTTPSTTPSQSTPEQSNSPAQPSPVNTPVVPTPGKASAKTPTTIHSSPPPPLSHSKAIPNAESHNDSGSSNANMPVILGVSLTIGVLLIIAALVACVCCLKKKRRRDYDYGGGRGNQYYNGGGLPTKWTPSNPSNTPSPPGILPPPPGSAWGQPAPPFHSSDMSSSGPQGVALPPPSPSTAPGFAAKSSFTYEELSAATNDFSQGNLIGQGGFGYVFKGVLPNGKEVAVKQLKAGSGQGEREFQAEVDIISRVHHRYLVSLVGYCMAGVQRMLIYEFVPNKTLEYHLHGKDVPTMDWPTRLNIALGSAKGLAYLHEDCHPRIIHRDIKSANILLENNFDAKVADFGLAKFTEDTNTHVSTRIMGTFGYLAPEYASSGKLTEKSDVFSFGVMLLELITGRRPVDNTMDESLVEWARPVMLQALAQDNYEDLVDPKLGGKYNIVEMQHMVASAAACVHHSARRRAKMSQICRALEGDVSLEDLKERAVPTGNSTQFGSSDLETSSYTSNMRQFRKVALDSADYGYSGPTSKYGLNLSDSSSSGEVSTSGDKNRR